MTTRRAWPRNLEPISVDEFVREDREASPEKDFSQGVLILDHVEALRDHVLDLVAARKSAKARDFVESIAKTLESALGGPPSPSIWMLREFHRNPHTYVDKCNVLLLGKLAESAALALGLLQQGEVPRYVRQEAYEVCLSMAKTSKKYRLLGLAIE